MHEGVIHHFLLTLLTAVFAIAALLDRILFTVHEGSVCCVRPLLDLLQVLGGWAR